MTDAIYLIMIERARQEDEWTSEHDDSHTDGSLAAAAACLAGEDFWSPNQPKWVEDFRDKHFNDDRISQLIIAGALIAAEIDRLQRVKK